MQKSLVELNHLLQIKNQFLNGFLNEPPLPIWKRRVAKVKEVLANEFLNPFDPTLGQEYLFNIVSDIPVKQGLADGDLATKERREDLYNTFLQNRISPTTEKTHDPIKRQEKALFENSGKKVTVTKNGKEKIIEAN